MKAEKREILNIRVGSLLKSVRVSIQKIVGKGKRFHLVAFIFASICITAAFHAYYPRSHVYVQIPMEVSS